MKNKNNKISKKKFLEIWKNYNDFELIYSSITEEILDDNLKMLNFKGEIKAFMKITKNNNEDKLDLILNKITSIETRIDKIETRIDYMQNQINLINTKVDNGFRELNSRMDKLENRMDKLETRMDNLELRMDKLETRMDKIESRINKLEICPTISEELKKGSV